MQLKADSSRFITPVCSASVLQQAENVLGRRAVEWAVQLAQDNARQLVESIAGLAGGASELHMVQIGTESMALRILTGIATGNALAELADEERLIIRDFVHRAVSLESLYVGLRKSHAYMSSRIMDECTRLVPVAGQAAELRRATRIVLDFMNEQTAQTERQYLSEQRQVTTSSTAMAISLARRLLDGPETLGPGDVEAISRRLRYQVDNRWHLGVVAWSQVNPTPDLQGLATQAKATLQDWGAASTLVLPHSHSMVWAWGGFPAKPDAGARPASAVHSSPGTVTPGLGHGVSVGTVAAGLEGFRSTHREAITARSVAETCPTLPRAEVRFEDVRLLALLLQDRSLAQNFAARELGGLVGQDPRVLEIRNTVRAFLDTHSPQAVARELHIARNTVSYRLKQAEVLVGRDLLDHQLELRTAIQIADHLAWDSPD